jgi:hypothetical protein
MKKPTKEEAARSAAQRLRAATVHRPVAARQPPVETGERLATFQRTGARHQEVRFVLGEREGRPCVFVTSWRQDDDGRWWRMKGRGLRLRPDELPDFLEAVAEVARVLAERLVCEAAGVRR